MLTIHPELNDKGQLYHICCSKGDIGRYVLMPGDPFRTEIIAQRLDNPVLVAHNREHKTWTGYLDGEKVSVCSTGMGCPSTAIALEELIMCGGDTFIRIGTAGRLCDDAQDESIQGIIITGSVRDEGTTRHYIPVEYPAIADRHIVAALADAAERRGYFYKEGLAQCKDAFYGQVDPDALPNGPKLKERWEAWKVGNVKASEMDTAALFVISSIRKCRAGAVMSFQSMEQTITIAVDALRELIAKDKEAL